MLVVVVVVPPQSVEKETNKPKEIQMIKDETKKNKKEKMKMKKTKEGGGEETTGVSRKTERRTDGTRPKRQRRRRSNLKNGRRVQQFVSRVQKVKQDVVELTNTRTETNNEWPRAAAGKKKRKTRYNSVITTGLPMSVLVPEVM